MCVADFPQFAHPEPPSGRVELAQGWQLASARTVTADGAALSTPGAVTADWHEVKHMPSTVLAALQDDGTYPDLYLGENLADVPEDLFRQDWWYRTTFTAPEGSSSYRLQFPGINYRAEVWLNGKMIAGSSLLVGMFNAHEIDATPWINAGGINTLAVKVTPEQALQDIDGIELADSWWDWLNWNRIGYQGPEKNPLRGNSYVADRNAGIFKPVYLSYSGAVVLSDPMVTSELPLPDTAHARLTVYSDIRNTSADPMRGVVRARISRPGKPVISVDQQVSLAPGEKREIRFDPDTFAALRVTNPDLWWPYTMGRPDLYDLRVEFLRYGRPTDTVDSRFGIRTVQQHRDSDEQFPDLGRGGSFYLTVNGRDFLVRGAAYTPDLLFQYDPQREDAILGYVRDLGLNMLRLEGKFPGDNIIERADELGIPLMYGWMCCNQWEKWWQWDDEDRRVASESMRSQILSLRGRPSAFLWANGSDGKPPAPVLDGYHGVLRDLHWPNAVVDTVSSMARDADGDPDWDGIHMAGPYSWRPPSYWFSGRYPATRGANAEQGDNEHIPPFASLQKFIPPDKLWPINDAWYFHAGANPSNAGLEGIRTAVVERYGSSRGAEEFARKAQLAHYESTRAQFEAFAATGWDNHKMTIYWMLNSHWPSFFGHLFDYYLRPGGAYYGAKKGLRPLSVVFDSYATGDHDVANVTVANQSPQERSGLRVRVRTYDLTGRVRDDRSSGVLTVASGGAVRGLALPRLAGDSPVVFVRCELLDEAGAVVADNTYWQSQQPDDLGGPGNDRAFDVAQSSWADMTPLNTMGAAPLQVSAYRSETPGAEVLIRLHNPGRQIAFFERAEIITTRDGDEILPIEYSDNYVTVYPGESVELTAKAAGPEPAANWVRVTGYNTAPVAVPIDQQVRR
ncbi:glycoside hydrolase family 2 protein [Mycolicibacterium frederiksbergense]|uniref:glycoside hydrolase family 2 protein n=1 Tax=Mycolicibacterium frederiksbergense TaxID=117567 RepID=UPI002475878C|nr:sugar-binding domain-containing protein [Mycolicibacterium frederiksbergense]